MSTIPSEEAVKIAKDNLAQIIGDAELIDKTFERGLVHSWSEPCEGRAFLFFGPKQRGALHEDLCRPQWPVKDTQLEKFVAHFAGEHASL